MITVLLVAEVIRLSSLERPRFHHFLFHFQVQAEQLVPLEILDLPATEGLEDKLVPVVGMV